MPLTPAAVSNFLQVIVPNSKILDLTMTELKLIIHGWQKQVILVNGFK